jgi:hypothetical protein
VINWSAGKTLHIFEFFDSGRDALYHEYGDEIKRILMERSEVLTQKVQSDTKISLTDKDGKIPEMHWLYNFAPNKQ